MNAPLFSSAYLALCDELRALRKSGEWKSSHANFDDYVVAELSLSKSKAKEWVGFSKLCEMCRAAELPQPASPDTVKPILALAQKRWLDTWELVLSYSDGRITAKFCESVMSRFGIISRKKLPANVRDNNRVRTAARNIEQAVEADDDTVSRAVDRVIDVHQERLNGAV